MTAEDALEALGHGVDAIWVSNHGGRQLDTLPATIEVLPEVRKEDDAGIGSPNALRIADGSTQQRDQGDQGDQGG